MRQEYLEYPELNRSMYVLYPAGDRLSIYENTLITILREDDSETLVKSLLSDADFCALADQQRFLLLFPNPIGGTWNWELDPAGRDDLGDVVELIRLFNHWDGPIDNGTYHNMHNARYFIGSGTGGSLLHALASINPINVAGIYTLGGKLAPRAKALTAGAAVSAILRNADENTHEFFIALNQVEQKSDGCFVNSVNDASFVLIERSESNVIDASVIRSGWERLFSKVCRPDCSEFGDMGPRTVRDDYRFIVHENDTHLGDNNGIAHMWFEYVPTCLKEDPSKPIPLLLFNHGFADTPGNLANTIKMHEIAEREGFLLVYPWSTDRLGWNQDMVSGQYDDVAYLSALIAHMKNTYAVDDTRIYIGGFSNGSAMAQVFAMTNPELIAAVIADNTRFCQNRNSKPFAIAGCKKLQYDYRMPVFYTYGTRDFEYPVVRGSGQQVQYDFWKSYNNITCKETPYIDHPATCGVGVAGDVVEEYNPNPRYPNRKYTTHRFFSNDSQPLNLYNYSLADGKGHDCNPEEAWLGWRYVRQFRRILDGSLKVEKQG